MIELLWFISVWRLMFMSSSLSLYLASLILFFILFALLSEDHSILQDVASKLLPMHIFAAICILPHMMILISL